MFWVSQYSFRASMASLGWSSNPFIQPIYPSIPWPPFFPFLLATQAQILTQPIVLYFIRTHTEDHLYQPEISPLVTIQRTCRLAHSLYITLLLSRWILTDEFGGLGGRRNGFWRFPSKYWDSTYPFSCSYYYFYLETSYFPYQSDSCHYLFNKY